jgi:hypothetical protein
MRQRFFPVTAGERQGVPARVFAPQRMLARAAAVLRKCVNWRLAVIAWSLARQRSPTDRSALLAAPSL